MITRQSSESGFTLQEILVAVNIAFLLISFGLMLFSSSSKLLGSWRTRTDVKNSVNGLIHRLTLDAQRSDAVTSIGDTLFEFRKTDGSMVKYQFIDSLVLRNDVVVNGDRRILLRSSLSYEKANYGVGIIRTSVHGTSRGYKYSQEVSIRTNEDAKGRFANTRQ